MIILSWIIAFILLTTVLAYHRTTLLLWTSCIAVFLVAVSAWAGLTTTVLILWAIFALLLLPWNISPLRRGLISKPLLQLYRRIMPTMSRTEREALAAGTVTWEGDLFRGNPSWKKLLAFKPPQLTAEEQAFIDGPVETLCQTINDWEITRELADLPASMWQFIKEQGFFGLIIPKQYGGKQFSAYAHSQILIKISGKSITAAIVVAVPNSLGPAELLLHYGTEQQKNYYLPRLATGEEIPCFALTSADAGSDASAMTDHGIVCWGEYQGQKTLGIKLTWNKRYITLAPVATVIGLAFKLYDPEHLLGKKEEIGITCALIPRNTPGVTIGRRHFPLDNPFQNGPTQGENVFVPLDFIIGGQAQAGKGWHMLMECLAAGRAITLPSSAMGGAKMACYATGAYARIRRQFHLPIGRFEGVEAPLARMAAYTYLIEAGRCLTIGQIDQGEKPAVASAIMKYHATELGRQIACDAMDIHGGKGICLGPKNYLGRGYEASPIAITVEGANILTRCMIIFGQGAIRCHPYVFAEMEAARLEDSKAATIAFDNALMKHIGFGFSNLVRSMVLALTGSFLVMTPRSKLKRYFQHATRFSSAFALIADMAMLSLGGNLKRKENISARLGDILSYLYLLSATLKRYHDQGQQVEDLPIAQFACDYSLFQIQQSLDEIFRNFPNRLLAAFLKLWLFPLGQRFHKPSDILMHKIAQLFLSPTAARERLTQGAYLSETENCMAQVQDALIKSIAAEPLEKTLRQAKRDGKIAGYTFAEQVHSALNEKVVTAEEFEILMQAEKARQIVIAVDDFSPEELIRR